MRQGSSLIKAEAIHKQAFGHTIKAAVKCIVLTFVTCLAPSLAEEGSSALPVH